MKRHVAAGLLGMAALAGLGCAQEPEAPPAEDRRPRGLGLFFPVADAGGAVFVDADVLISRQLVLASGTVLYTVYSPPRSDDADVKQAKVKERRKEAYGGGARASDTGSQLPAHLQAIRDRALATEWKDPLVFRAMLNRSREHELFVVYRGPAGKEIEALDLPDGVCWVWAGNAPKAVWIHEEGTGAKAGIAQGDTVARVGGEKPETLEAFRRLLQKPREAAPGGGGAGLVLALLDAAGNPKTAEIKGRATLSGSALDLF